ncbi:23 kDa integral membrane protein-like [Copidosoma floridanum]|uniref:23 kDa integral membrane protein-like n=1 Tax=Copidosoma floridanum TaxID=29053 RepID=UPI0006C9D7A1|nr:23 kDa integral membrane protein-like [Copidosoma floridanum]
MRWIKFLLCSLNFSFLLTGVTIVLKSKAIHDVHNQFDYFFNSSYISPIVLLITAGVFFIAVSIFSCYGVIKESTCMVLTSAFLLSTVLILEFVASVALYVARDNIADHLKSKISDAMHQYDNNSEAKKAVDFLQGHLQCCGWNGPDDWIGIDGRTSIYRVPCWTRLCKENEFSCYNLVNQGCFGELGKIAKNRASYLTTAASSIILIQFHNQTIPNYTNEWFVGEGLSLMSAIIAITKLNARIKQFQTRDCEKITP